MKSVGMNLTIEDIEFKITDKKERYARQQFYMENLEQTMRNTQNDIGQLEYTRMQLAQKRTPRISPREKVPAFFAHASRVYDRIQSRLHHPMNYTWFCLVLCHRYRFESRSRRPDRRYLTPATVLGYFKKEREN